MPKKVKAVWLTAKMDLSELASGLCSENTYAEVLELIRQIDTEQQDWTFTRMLKALVDELMEEDPGTRVDSKTDSLRDR